MKTIDKKTIDLIQAELESIPEKYASTNFNSTHEGLAVLQEEFEELKNEVFWGEVADMKIMLAQLELMLDPERIHISVERKMKRLEGRL